MTRALSALVHNWPLKIAAIALAILLYVGLVLSTSSKEWPSPVLIEVRNQPSAAVCLNCVQYVSSIRYFAPADARISGDVFTSWIDLGSATPDPSNGIVVTVHVSSPDPQVQILDWSPRQVSIRLDPLRTKSVPVQVVHDAPPDNLQVRDPVVDTNQVTVSGTQSAVSQVVAAVARVRIDPSGVSIDQQVDLVAVDARGEAVNPVSLKPTSVRVKILVGSNLQSRSLPLNAVVTGTPANGYEITLVTVAPAVVTVEGDADTLAALTRIDTKPLSVTGAVSDVSGTVALDLPAGVQVLSDQTVHIVAAVTATHGTRTFSVGIVLFGAHDDRTYQLSTDQVLVTLGGASAALAAIRGDQLVVTADVDALAPGTHEVTLKASLPAGISLNGVSPAKISVTVGAPPSPSPSPTPSPS